MASVYANRIVITRIVGMMGVEVHVDLVLPIKFAEMVTVYASLTVEIENVVMMDVGVLVDHAQEIKRAWMENVFVCLIVSPPLISSVGKTMVVEGNVLVLEGIV